MAPKSLLALSQKYDTFFVPLSVLYIQIVVILAGLCHICAFLMKTLSRFKVQLLTNGFEHMSVVGLRT